MFMILFVLDDTSKLESILEAWDSVGIGGVTILPSTGLGRIKQFALRDNLPLIPSIEDLITHTEKLNRTIFTIVSSQALVDKVVKATEEICGDLNNPNTGIMAVIPIAQVYGLQRNR